jgi:hypothetical protein
LLEHAERLARNHPEWELIQNYWMLERPALASKTRETIDADFTGMFDPLTRGKIGELFGTTTNLTPDDIFGGKIVVINLPVAKYREAGQYAALIWAQLFQRAVDRRAYTPPVTRPVFLWEDEAHYFTVDQDALFQTTARSKGISTVRLSQNLPNFLDAYGRDGRPKVDTLLGNHATKIFHRNGDPTTNEWASKVIAKETTYKHSISTSGSIHTAVGVNSQTSVTEVEEDSCAPKEFIGLKNGGKKNNCIVEGILFQSGRLWLKDQRLDSATISSGPTMNGGDGNPQTPFQEAISLITIVAILVGVGAYLAALKNVPLLSPALFWVAVQVYYLFPALMSLPGSQVPMLVAAGAVGTMFFIFTIPLAYLLAGAFSRAGIDSMERQTARLKRLRSDHKKRRRDNDKFSVD